MNYKAVLSVVILNASTGLTTLSHGQSLIAIANGSFESPSGSAPNGFGNPSSGTIGAWEFSRTGVLPATLTDVTFGPNGLATDGSNVASLEFLVGALAEVSIFQDLGVGFAANTAYSLTFDTAQFSILSVLSNAEVSLYAGGIEVASLGGGPLLSLLSGGGAMTSVELQYMTGVSAPVGNIGIGFSAGGIAEIAGSGLVIDNVQLTATPVPEPGSALLMGVAGTWMLRRLRRPSGMCG